MNNILKIIDHSVTDRVFDAIIIGAGISGLTLSRRLSRVTNNFLILEKSNGVGGRVATRRDGDDLYDHGAQFYKISPKHENSLDKYWSDAGLVKNWFIDNEVTHKVSPTGMTSLAKLLIDKKPLILKKEVFSIRIEDDVVILVCLDQSVLKCKKVFITAPVPQAIALLKRSEFCVPVEIEKINYASALVGLFKLENNLVDHMPVYIENVSTEIFSISRQDAKLGGHGLTFTVTMSTEWSQNRFESTDIENLASIQEHFGSYLTINKMMLNSIFLKSQLKKWRYSHPLNPMNTGYFELNSQIILMGDGFSGSSVNAAVKSGESVPL